MHRLVLVQLAQLGVRHRSKPLLVGVAVVPLLLLAFPGGVAAGLDGCAEAGDDGPGRVQVRQGQQLHQRPDAARALAEGVGVVAVEQQLVEEQQQAVALREVERLGEGLI